MISFAKVKFLQEKSKVDLILFLFSGVVGKILPMLSGVSLVYFLDPKEYGKSALFISLVSIFSSVSSFGIGSLIVREKYIVNKDEYRDLLSSSVFFVLVSTFLCGFVYSAYLYFFLESFDVFYFSMLLFSSFVLSFYSIVVKNFVVSLESKRFLLFEFLKNSFVSVFAFIFVFLMSDMGFISRSIGISVGYIGVLFLCCAFFSGSIKYVKRVYLKRVFLFGLTMLPQIVSNLIKMGVDKVLVAAIFSAEVLGIYSYLFLVCSSFLIVGNALNNVATPKIMNLYATGAFHDVAIYRKKLVVVLLLSFFVFNFTVFLFLYLFSPADYFYSFFDVVFLLASFLLQPLYMLYGKIFLHLNKMFFLGCVNFIGVFLYIFVVTFFKDLGPCFSLFLYSLFLFCFVFFAGGKIEGSKK